MWLTPMNAKEILAELKSLGRDSYKNLFVKNYGVKEPCFGVPISELKKIQKRIKTDYQLALDLYASGNYDAMYLAGLIADDARMTRKDLQGWVENAYAAALPSATVPWVAAGSRHGHELAMEWIDSPKPLVAVAGWGTLGSLAALKSDDELNLPVYKKLLQRVEKTIHQAPDLTRYAMNDFIIAVGIYVKPLAELALGIGQKLGPVTANLGNNQCQIPSAPDSIRKAQQRGAIGKKRKTVKC